MTTPTPSQQLDNLRSLKIDFMAHLLTAGRMLDASANDLRPQDIADASEWLGHAEDRLARMMEIVEERLADMREQDRQQRHDELRSRGSGAYDRMAAQRLGLPVAADALVLAEVGG